MRVADEERIGRRCRIRIEISVADIVFGGEVEVGEV